MEHTTIWNVVFHLMFIHEISLYIVVSLTNSLHSANAMLLIHSYTHHEKFQGKEFVKGHLTNMM